jgi:hydroxypyruvate reductase
VGKVHAALARAAAQGKGPFQKPCVILSGGETTVTIRKDERATGRSAQVKEETAQRAGDTEQSTLLQARPGRGGRAGEFCLGLAVALQAQPHVWAIAADTDGIDGIEDNAGACVSPDTLVRAEAKGTKPTEYLDRNDAYSFFEALGDLVVTGPTHTNVNDFRAMLVL